MNRSKENEMSKRTTLYTFYTDGRRTAWTYESREKAEQYAKLAEARPNVERTVLVEESN